ncbi:uncharacterized protein LOC134239755 [Saccostrea cucullata]|uniref:uncharacterized protein LOC134239755 n=1 Tax=Saccostrea cuccullata TaxID=36930 RepID=UPI002ED1003D
MSSDIIEKDPSVNLQLGFLWIFGLANMVYLSIKIIIYFECLVKTTNDDAHNTFLIFSNIIYLVFLILQTVLLTYNKEAQFQSTFFLHFSIASILAANFSIWYSSTINNMFAQGNTTHFQNRSCFHASEIQKLLGRNLSIMLLPPQLEFCILASTLLVSLWQNASKLQSLGQSSAFSEIHSDNNTTFNTRKMDGYDVLALIFGIFVNLPILISTVLLDFVYEWKNKDLIIVLDCSETLSALCTCIIVYVCCQKLKSYSNSVRKQMIFREYILILSSTGIMAYFTFGCLASMSGLTLSKSTIVSRIFGILETFLQTLLLVSYHRYTLREYGSKCIAACGMILVITNLMYWLQDSYNRNIFTKTRYIGFIEWHKMEILLVPLMVFYRFFSAMSAYSMYKKFKSYENVM